MDEPRVRIEVEDHVAVVSLNRPDKHNALDGAMFEGILAAAEEVAETPGVRAVVLHGNGKSFCSGLDVASLMSGPISMDDILQRNGRRANVAQRACTDWIDLPVPVIAAIHGNCFGGGLQIALGADIRIAAPDARLSVMESRWGLVPDMGITSTLPRLAGIDIPKELTYTGGVITRGGDTGTRDRGARVSRAGPAYAHGRRSARGSDGAGRGDLVSLAGRDARGQAPVR